MVLFLGLLNNNNYYKHILSTMLDMRFLSQTIQRFGGAETITK